MYSRNIVRAIKNYKINFVIKMLILSDFLVWSSFQLLAPIFAIFITDKIQGGIEVVGIAAGIYWLTKSLFEIPVGIFIDRTKAESDDLYLAFGGTVVTSLVYLSYVFIDSVSQLYILQAVLGIGAAVAFPGWYSIFTKHVDKGKEAFEWSLYDVVLGVGMAGAAALGGFIAHAFGFNALFLIISIFTLLGAFILLTLKSKIYK